MRAVERSLSSWPRTIAAGTGAGGAATGAAAPQPSSVAARATPSQMRGEQRMIQLLLAAVAPAVVSGVPNGVQRRSEVCDRARLDGKPTQGRRLAHTAIPRSCHCWRDRPQRIDAPSRSVTADALYPL